MNYFQVCILRILSIIDAKSSQAPQARCETKQTLSQKRGFEWHWQLHIWTRVPRLRSIWVGMTRDGWRNKGKISSGCASPGTLKVHCYSSFVLQMRNCSCLAHLKMALVFETVIWISA